MDADPADVLGASRPVLGMVHLPALPGAPRYGGDRATIRRRALADARALVEGGIDGIVVENFGDAPFYPDSVPPHVVAELTAVTTALTDAVEVPVGVNVLRNDAASALSVAAASGARFVRVNVHVGVAATDQGLLEGRAHDTLRLRERIDADVAILADVDVKHARGLGERAIERTAREAVERGLADGLIVSGPATGEATSTDAVTRVSTAVADLDRTVPVLAGSGVTADTVADVLAAGADGAIVGTALKEGAETANPVDPERVRAVVEASRQG